VEWFEGQLQQGTNRKLGRMPTIEEFIPMRRATIGCGMVEAMIEYSLDIDLPDYVFEHPIIRAMSDATNDLMTWPNVGRILSSDRAPVTDINSGNIGHLLF
jgi:hypothetical protein